jgi:hypothetical protein
MTAGFGLPHPFISLFRLEISLANNACRWCALGYNEFDFFLNEEYKPFDGRKIKI